MKIVPTIVTYHTVLDTPPYMELQFLFDTKPGKTYQIRTTVDGINYKDAGSITLPPNAKLSWPVDPRGGDPWPQLIDPST